jgi:hypothetical protein
MKKNLYCLIMLTMLTVAAGCNQATGQTDEQKDKESFGGNQTTPEKNQKSLAESFKGSVMEIIPSGRYVYVQIDTGKKKVWVAVPEFDGKPGDKVVVPPGVPVADFQSKKLNRKFDMVYFVGGIRRDDESAANQQAQMMPQDHPPIGAPGEMPKTHPPMGELSERTEVKIGTVEKAKDGQTVSEILTDKKKFNGKNICVRAIVVKFTPDIMDKNWLHAQDGSGKEGSNDLIVTTQAKVKVGDTVLIRGTVSLDRDFGFGLKYPVIIENAEITVE